MTSHLAKPLKVLWRSRLGEAEVRAADLPRSISIDVDVASDQPDMEGVQVLVDGNPPERLLDAPDVRHLIVPYAGIRREVREAVRKRPHLRLHNSHFNAPFVAQHALALVLACSDRIVRYDRALRHGDWTGWDGPDSVHLAGRKAVLLGFGAIGRALAPMLQGVGLTVEAVRRRPTAGEDGIVQRGVEALHDALSRAEVLVVTLPATPDTEGLVDEAAFAALPDGAIVVNVGRASVLDEEAAWNALGSGRLAALGLDVWWQVPDGRAARTTTLPSRFAFHAHPDVVLSPHRANAVANWRRASVLDVLRTLDGIASGRDDTRNLVDVTAGY